MASGRAEIDFVNDGGFTRLLHLYQKDPLRILFPNTGPGEPKTGTLVTTSGGFDATPGDAPSRSAVASQVSS